VVEFRQKGGRSIGNLWRVATILVRRNKLGKKRSGSAKKDAETKVRRAALDARREFRRLIIRTKRLSECKKKREQPKTEGALAGEKRRGHTYTREKKSKEGGKRHPPNPNQTRALKNFQRGGTKS